jgi:predicted methyltransferase
MIPPRPTELAHLLLGQVIRPGDLVIDATAGNGHDTVFLAGSVGASGRVLAYDVQCAALASATLRIMEAGYADRVVFHRASHVDMITHAQPGSVAVVMFNLGYLPGEDHQLTTEASETIAALDAAVLVLKPGGTITVICYPGHDSGVGEASAVEKWMSKHTENHWRVAKYAMLGTLRPAPFLIMATAPS